jgi:hypothetical protein
MRRVALVGALAVAIVAVAAVLTRGHDSSAAAAVAKAAQKTFDSGSSRFSITMAMDPRSSLRDFREEGVMDYRRHRGRVTYLAGETIYDGDVIYTKWPGLTEWMPKAKPWLRATGPDRDPLDPGFRALRDPASLLEFLRAVSSGVHKAGDETIDGVATTRYEGTLDLEKVVESAPADERDDLRDVVDLWKEEGTTTIPFVVWVDENGIARRLHYEERLDDRSMSTTMDFFEFGVPVVLDLPPPDQVMTIDEFLALMQGYWHEHPDGGCGSGSAQTSESSGEGGAVVTLCSISIGEKAEK